MSSGSAGRPPNVLLLMCDQLRWDAVGAHGNAHIETPHLDRLIASGTTFTRCYTEAPVCVPARATMLTGRLPHRNDVYDNGDVLDPAAETFATIASAAAHRTQAIGKMHFTPARQGYGLQHLMLSEEIPATRAEDEFLQYLAAEGFGHVEEPHGIRHELYYVPQVSQLPQDLHTTAWTGRNTVEFIDAAAGGEPWLCWTSFIKPHPPFDPPAPWFRRYDPLDMPDPVRDPSELERLDYWVRYQHRFKWTSPDMPVAMLRTLRAYYYACVSFIDHWIGHILDALDRTGERENTLVVFVADHGEHLGDHWAFGKRTFHDSAARVPLVISRPGTLPEGRRIADLAGLCDLAPTIAHAIGADPSRLDGDGQSLLPRVIEGVWAQPREPWIGIFAREARATYAAFDDQTKYVYSAADDREYALAIGDGSEETNPLRADDPLFAHAMELGARMRERLAREGLAAVLDGDGWRQFGSVTADWDEADRSSRGRGRQYAKWMHESDDPKHPAAGAAVAPTSTRIIDRLRRIGR